jgi:glycosyltransferase involved in cell wall biosynthesis
MRARLDALLRGRTPVVHLPNPVDVTGLRERTATPDAGTTESLDQRTTGRRFAVVGRLVALKAVDELLETFAVRSGPLDRLDIVGDGPERGALEALADRLGATDRVRFHGRLDDPSSVIAHADVLIQPSREEGMPNAVLEALAVGTPVLATTDLHMLTELAASAAHGAVRIVPRADLGEALATTHPHSGPIPRPSLLPDAFHRDTVVLQLMGLAEPQPA